MRVAPLESMRKTVRWAVGCTFVSLLSLLVSLLVMAAKSH